MKKISVQHFGWKIPNYHLLKKNIKAREPKADWQELLILIPMCRKHLCFTHVVWIAIRHLGLHRPTFLQTELPEFFNIYKFLSTLKYTKLFSKKKNLSQNIFMYYKI